MMKDSFSSADILDEPIEIEVQSYSGYKADEKPRAIFISGRKYDVVSITDSFLAESLYGSARKHHFKVKCSDASVKNIYYDFEKDKWFLWGKIK